MNIETRAESPGLVFIAEVGGVSKNAGLMVSDVLLMVGDHPVTDVDGVEERVGGMPKDFSVVVRRTAYWAFRAHSSQRHSEKALHLAERAGGSSGRRHGLCS